MSWLDFIGNIGNKVSNLQSKVGNALGNALIGKQEPMIDYVDIKGVDVNSPEFAENMPIAEIGVTEAPRVGGLLNDIRSGAKENFATGFAAPNWEQTITPDGRKKGLGYRFGEGLGSFARFAESPLGRGLLMAGIVGASGGSGLEALGYGTGAGLLNQQSRMKDKMYRNELEKMGFDTTGITGYVGDDTFNKIYQSKQLQDNAEYRNVLLAGQRKDQEMAIQQRQAELKQKTLSDAADRALKNRELDIKEKQAIGKPLSDTQVKNVKDLADSLNEANEIIAKYSNSKYDAGFGVVGAVRRNPLTSKFDPLASEMRQDIDLFRKTVARAKEGGRLTDQDQKYYEKAVLNPNLTRADFLSLANEFKNKMERQYDTALDMYELQGKNVNNFRNYYENNQTTTNEGWAF